MKWLADEPVVKARLLELASTKARTPAGDTRRMAALAALEGKVDLGRSATPSWGSRSIPRALPRCATTPSTAWATSRARRRCPSSGRWLPAATTPACVGGPGELVLAIGGSAVVGEFFSKLPSAGEYPQEELEGYATRMGQMTPLPTAALREQLSGSAWYNRVIAIRFFERKGSAGDVAKLEAANSGQGGHQGSALGQDKDGGRRSR